MVSSAGDGAQVALEHPSEEGGRLPHSDSGQGQGGREAMEEEGDFCRAPALNCSLPAHVGSVVHQAVCLKTNPTLAVRKEAPRTSLGVSEGVDTAVAVLKDTGQIAAVGITVLAAAQALFSTSRYHRHPLS